MFCRDQDAASAQGHQAPQAPKDQLDLEVLKGHQGPWDLGASMALKGMQDQWALKA